MNDAVWICCPRTAGGQRRGHLCFHWQTDLWHHVFVLTFTLCFTVFLLLWSWTSLKVIKRVCVSVCFRPPRDLDSKACVTIGEKVILFHLCTFPNPIQGLYFFLLHNSSLFTFFPSAGVFLVHRGRLSKGCVRCKERPAEHYGRIEHFWLWGDWNVFYCPSGSKNIYFKLIK